MVFLWQNCSIRRKRQNCMGTKKKKEKKIQKEGNSTIGFLLPKAIDFHTHNQLLGIFHSATKSPMFSLRCWKPDRTPRIVITNPSCNIRGKSSSFERNPIAFHRRCIPVTWKTSDGNYFRSPDPRGSAGILAHTRFIADRQTNLWKWTYVAFREGKRNASRVCLK